jgi:hypothetical protein
MPPPSVSCIASRGSGTREIPQSACADAHRLSRMDAMVSVMRDLNRRKGRKVGGQTKENPPGLRPWRASIRRGVVLCGNVLDCATTWKPRGNLGGKHSHPAICSMSDPKGRNDSNDAGHAARNSPHPARSRLPRCVEGLLVSVNQPGRTSAYPPRGPSRWHPPHRPRRVGQHSSIAVTAWTPMVSARSRRGPLRRD